MVCLKDSHGKKTKFVKLTVKSFDLIRASSQAEEPTTSESQTVSFKRKKFNNKL